jgi:hypothetical protein
VQGFSGIKTLSDGTFLVLSDNGFGNKANSPDAALTFHRVRPDWPTGRVERLATTFLHDPDRVLPFTIVNEGTAKRYLTGGDLDIESFQIVGDSLYFGGTSSSPTITTCPSRPVGLSAGTTTTSSSSCASPSSCGRADGGSRLRGGRSR